MSAVDERLPLHAHHLRAALAFANPREGAVALREALLSSSPWREGARSEICFVDVTGDPPRGRADERLDLGLRYAATPRVTVRLVVYGSREGEVVVIKEQEVFVGEVPFVGERGAWVVDGREVVLAPELRWVPDGDGGRVRVVAGGALLREALVAAVALAKTDAVARLSKARASVEASGPVDFFSGRRLQRAMWAPFGSREGCVALDRSDPRAALSAHAVARFADPAARLGAMNLGATARRGTKLLDLPWHWRVDAEGLVTAGDPSDHRTIADVIDPVAPRSPSRGWTRGVCRVDAPSAPRVRSALDEALDDGALRADAGGRVLAVDEARVVWAGDDGAVRSAPRRDRSLPTSARERDEVALAPGDRFAVGDVIASPRGGRWCGRDLVVTFARPALSRGVISESAARAMRAASGWTLREALRDSALGVVKTRAVDGTAPALDADGVVREGERVREGDVVAATIVPTRRLRGDGWLSAPLRAPAGVEGVVRAVTTRKRHATSEADQARLARRWARDEALFAAAGERLAETVTDALELDGARDALDEELSRVRALSGEAARALPGAVRGELVVEVVDDDPPLEVLVTRGGHAVFIGEVLPDAQMPRLADGTMVDLVAPA
ncbi:MAG: hypothetical protein R3A52_24305, partial [Polyangiales bacterium]